MKSMTGFGRGEKKSSSGKKFQVEIFSINRKQFDAKVILPKEAFFLEPNIRRIVSDNVHRGSVNVKVNIIYSDSSISGFLKVNESVVSNYIKKIKMFQERHEIHSTIDMAVVLSLPGTISEVEPDLDFDEDIPALEDAVKEAFVELNLMRESEGEKIQTDISEKIEGIERIISDIERIAKDVPIKQKEIFLKRLNESGLGLNCEDERILKEIAIFADKSDVSEEIFRLKSHIMQMKSFIEKDEPVGRKIDFLIQEMFREMGTLGCKIPSAEATGLVISFKAELEKMREQIQNIE